VTSLAGDELSVASTDSQVEIAVVIKNNSLRDYPATTVLEIRDSQQYTAYLQLLHAEIVPRISEKRISVSWVPDEKGEYEIRSFAISDLGSLQVLSPPAVAKVSVGEEQVVKGAIPVENAPGPASDLELYALQRINEDRAAAGLSPVSLSRNAAAQIHAEDMLKTRQISHWLTSGEKPYIVYSRLGGLGAVSQNVATSGYLDDDDYDGCSSGAYICNVTNPYSEIDRSEYLMLYEDKECCNDGHRDNILDPHHTHVSIGVAYDDYFFAFVQNFENQYAQWIRPIARDVTNDVSMAGFFANNRDANSDNDLDFYTITVTYDAPPTPAAYQANKDRQGYGAGDLLAVVVPPAAPGTFYVKPADYDIIEAKDWSKEATGFDIRFSLQGLIDAHGKGIYTVSVWATKEAAGKPFIASEMSLTV
jgi:uncharacterized protein YkwD